MHSPLSSTYLLVGSDQSSTCLNCHENATGGSYHMSTSQAVMDLAGGPNNYTAGGDFGWLRRDAERQSAFGFEVFDRYVGHDTGIDCQHGDRRDRWFRAQA